MPERVRAGRQAAYGGRSAGRKGTAARSSPETEETGTAPANRIVHPVYGRR